MGVLLKHGATVTCPECGFCTADTALFNNHSCDIQAQGGICEDYPACGHEQGDCNGQRYGSDEFIKEDAMRHFECEHEHGFCRLDDRDDD
jgi:hypothetical protein